MEKISKELIDICNNRNFRRLFYNSFNSNFLNELIKLTSFLNECYKEIDLSQRVWHIKNNNYSLQLCEICNKPKNFNKSKYFSHKECGLEKMKQSLKISMNKEKTKEKYKSTCLERYGVENSMKHDTFKEKQEQTNLKKYGVKKASMLPEVKIKTKETFIKRYGVENPVFTIESRSKIIQSAKNLYESEEIQYIDNLGNGYHKLKCKKCNHEFTFRNTNQYRKEINVGLCPICYPLINSLSMQEKSFADYISTIHPLIERNNRSALQHNNFELDVYIKDLKLAFEYNGDYFHMNPKKYSSNDFNKAVEKTATQIWEKDELKKKICKNKGINLFTIWEDDWINDRLNQEMIIEKIINDYQSRQIYSEISKRIKGFVNTYYNENDHLVIQTKSENLVITIHGISDAKEKRMCDKIFTNYKIREFRNIQIWIDQYYEKKEQYLNFIENQCKKSKNIIYARKCIIKEFTNDIRGKKIVYKFEDNYHLQGNVYYTRCFGLYYEEELISIMSFALKKKEKNSWEISRYCTKSDFTVIGGANKLWSKFLEIVNPRECITYCDISWFNGNVYRNMKGLVEYKPSEKSYFYLIDNLTRTSRQSCRKSILQKIDKSSINQSETSFVENNLGYFQVYNCGNYKFVYTRS